jgi:ParB-like chromosome segregation protein Spo0J
MLISLADIHANPFRDFELHPIDQAQIERLKASLNADGFWASVVARKAVNGYEIAFGHHRIEAARQLGMESAPIEVRNLDDRQMVRMLAAENATQRGSTAAAALDAVQAICRILAYDLLRWDEASFSRIHDKLAIDYARCRGRLEAGSGIGEPCVMAFAPQGAFTENQVRLHLGILKDCGRMAEVIASAQARANAELRAEQEEAERALAEAERREAEARDAAEKVEAAKRTKKAKQTANRTRKATEGAGKAAKAAQRQPLIFDYRCTSLFKLDSHAETFRQVVTSETFQSYLPYDRQYEFAKAVLQAIRENNPNKKEVTAADIREECYARIESGLGMFRQTLRAAPERPYHHELVDGLNFLRRAVADCQRGVALANSALSKGETLTAKQKQQLERYLAVFETALRLRDKLPEHNLRACLAEVGANR